MTGRGIDQILHESVHPVLFEFYVKDARHYVELAEKANGPIQKPVPLGSFWSSSSSENMNATAFLKSEGIFSFTRGSHSFRIYILRPH